MRSAPSPALAGQWFLWCTGHYIPSYCHQMAQKLRASGDYADVSVRGSQIWIKYWPYYDPVKLEAAAAAAREQMRQAGIPVRD